MVSSTLGISVDTSLSCVTRLFLIYLPTLTINDTVLFYLKPEFPDRVDFEGIVRVPRITTATSSSVLLLLISSQLRLERAGAKVRSRKY